ncbi:peptide chain release factor N(5)-glutamine methyltransferase [Synechococcus sp. CCY9202]|uniref:peptide chain release factor N(5)-glutamine methyltransferase n=1 Tax=Synechococcus sp. CCY9202 TaxID=174698 RepID=UPI002B2024A0|nr:peptide chain release factor N(5)-glutamine methyltransferase [Synechococcus sp. CCY9202]MEA5422370.1 peptide chain release factor N(5)-glutamine methyltransferase [Synechococcus sp. CCY9202]
MAPSNPLRVSATALLAWRRRCLGQGGHATDLDWLLDLAGGVAWTDLQALRLHPDRQLTLRLSLEDLAALWNQHLATAVPLQYLVGLCPWRDLQLQVAPGVLIPRQETELLVELALTMGPPTDSSLLWADLGTGSGCLALALARAWPASRGLAVDLSVEALVIARNNWQVSGVQEQITPLQGHWWEPLRPWWGRLDLVVANPPYIPSAVVDKLDPVVRYHEPRLALDGGADGLAALRCIAARAAEALAPGGLLLLEHHHDQSAAVLDLLAAAALQDVNAASDLEGTLRFALARRAPQSPAAR